MVTLMHRHPVTSVTLATRHTAVFFSNEAQGCNGVVEIGALSLAILVARPATQASVEVG